MEYRSEDRFVIFPSKLSTVSSRSTRNVSGIRLGLRVEGTRFPQPNNCSMAFKGYGSALLYALLIRFADGFTVNGKVIVGDQVGNIEFKCIYPLLFDPTSEIFLVPMAKVVSQTHMDCI